MKTSTIRQVKRQAALIALAASSLIITSCAVTPDSPDGAAQARSDLTALQNNPNLAGRARVEFREAETAVRIAEQPLKDDQAALGEHRVYIASRKVSIAEAKATTRYAEAEREKFSNEREQARLQARTREAGQAREQANQAREEVSQAREEVNQAREQANQARNAADAARAAENKRAAVAARQAKEYQRQIDSLQAEVTDRGLVLTLGDVLFATGSAELQGGANPNLDKLVVFLNEYPERQVRIEGHTDNVGSAQYNQGLSLRRAQSVSSYLARSGISSQRLSSFGIGLDQPVASNDSDMGRQQNRRVELIIDDPSE